MKIIRQAMAIIIDQMILKAKEIFKIRIINLEYKGRRIL